MSQNEKEIRSFRSIWALSYSYDDGGETVEKIWIITFLSAILAVSLAVFRRDNEDSGDRRIEKKKRYLPVVVKINGTNATFSKTNFSPFVNWIRSK